MFKEHPQQQSTVKVKKWLCLACTVYMIQCGGLSVCKWINFKVKSKLI